MGWIENLSGVEQKIKYSQNGEEYYLKFILDNLGIKNGFLVDIGANDGVWLSNTNLFRELGWDSLLIDGKEFPGIHNHFITKETVNEVLSELNCPKEFDLLSLDIDGNDYWVLDQILNNYSPKLIISEYNAEHPPHESKTIEYDPFFIFRANDYYGYTFKAGEKLAAKHGYTIIFQNGCLNLYYLRNDLLPKNCKVSVPNNQYRWWNVPGEGNWIYV